MICMVIGTSLNESLIDQQVNKLVLTQIPIMFICLPIRCTINETQTIRNHTHIDVRVKPKLMFFIPDAKLTSMNMCPVP